MPKKAEQAESESDNAEETKTQDVLARRAGLYEEIRQMAALQFEN